MTDALRHIPAVNALADRAMTDERMAAIPRSVVVEVTRDVLDTYRAALLENATTTRSIEALADDVIARTRAVTAPRLPRTINATGVIIHTGLGRSPLSAESSLAALNAAASYTPVELSLTDNTRGQRSTLIRELLCRLTGAESATVVNNNAAALVLTLAALATRRNVVVSRGELIEIGGSFRLPEIMRASGAGLREIGTTNRTRLTDYEEAIDPSVAALLKVHPSNFRVEGFSEGVSIDELVAVGRAHGVPVIDDIGSGALVTIEGADGPLDEPTATASVAAGADLVLFSGDKLLGGPQAGIIVGRTDAVAMLERHPLMRAMRMDKIRLAALAATLQGHLDPDAARTRIPTLRMAAVPTVDLRTRAESMARELADIDAEVEVIDTSAYLGGGSVPTQAISSIAIAIAARSISDDALAAALRSSDTPILPRLTQGRVVLDLRTVDPSDDATILGSLRSILQI